MLKASQAMGKARMEMFNSLQRETQPLKVININATTRSSAVFLAVLVSIYASITILSMSFILYIGTFLVAAAVQVPMDPYIVKQRQDRRARMM